MSDGREVVAHVAVALACYVRDARSDGLHVPPEVVRLAELLLEAAKARQEATPLGHLDGTLDAGHMRPMLTKREAAAELRCSVRTLERLVADGDLLAVKVAGGVRIRRADLDAFIAGLPPRAASFRDTVALKGEST